MRLRQLRAAARPRLKHFFKATCLLIGGWVGIGLIIQNSDFGPWPVGGSNWVTRQLFDLSENMVVWWIVGGFFVFVIVNHMLDEAGYRWRLPIEVYDPHSPEHSLHPWER